VITILTGAPGAGKTCAMVSLMATLAKDRAVFADGVNGLGVDHTDIDARKWHEVVADGGVIAVDEGQRIWRPRGPGQKVPEDIAAMETHRHRGLDLFITTQHPKLLDGNIKNLCGRHVHIRDLGMLGRWWYEWPEAADPASWRTAPIKKKYKLDPKAFALYKSASLHVKPIRSFPIMVVVLCLAVLISAVTAFYGYKSISAKMNPPGKTSPVPSAPGTGLTVGTSGAAGMAAGTIPTYITDYAAFVPRVSSKPETAPAYDELRRVKDFPQVVGAICVNLECKCLDQQGKNAGLSPKECAQWMANPPFNPYRDPKPNPGAVQAVSASVAQPQSNAAP
jgi:zona occludens toxin